MNLLRIDVQPDDPVPDAEGQLYVWRWHADPERPELTEVDLCVVKVPTGVRAEGLVLPYPCPHGAARLARSVGHGKVFPRPDGFTSECPGVEGECLSCLRDMRAAVHGGAPA